ncbi:conserved hypothetical protein [Halorhabdus utahensis DSM 12940]|uniref:Integral membrane protein n=1 Tax=Halorhabdus utahensis (strain DSM 12940 / JCM 11049 / AX-2) TaxID=519442 RepID=C7NV06_HALUD|nr:DUF2391 family protein [Halorhabdus utahensis]ACV12418.1 conserved hypothetical protein [Halorhabdus utahensis DSM 12940]
MVGPPRYKLADTAQQIVGGFLLAGPFVVTEEVWTLADGMSWFHGLATAVLVAVIGYGALYQADDDRDPDTEAEVAGLPLRFLSLISVAFGSVALLAILLNAPASFLEGMGRMEQLEVTLRVVSVGAIFSVVGAATADSVF